MIVLSHRDDVLILMSSGTAAVCNLGFMAELDTSGNMGGTTPCKSLGNEAKLLQVTQRKIYHLVIEIF